MQGNLRKDRLTVTVHSECAHCAQAMDIEIDSDLNYTVKQDGCDPVVFVPDVNLFRLEAESIIETF